MPSYFAQTDSVQAYNALNVRVARALQHGFLIEGNYTFSKNMDQVTNGDGPNSNANQTNPANNKTEYGPSDSDTRNRVTISAVYTTPRVHSSNFLVKAVANGWQVNGIFTAHSGFPYTPVTYNLQTTGVQGAAVVGPTRPLGILYQRRHHWTQLFQRRLHHRVQLSQSRTEWNGRRQQLLQYHQTYPAARTELRLYPRHRPQQLHRAMLSRRRPEPRQSRLSSKASATPPRFASRQTCSTHSTC